MKKFLTFCLIAIALSLSCDEPITVDPDTGFEIFTIPSGQHSSIMRSEAFNGSGIRITALFDDSAIYTLETTNNQGDINKLTGISDCNQHHQSESARFGWRWYQDELQMLAYVYREGVLSYELMGSVAIDVAIDLSIVIEADQYLFTGDGLQSVTMPRTANCDTGENYWLWPYFGGDETAPHQVKIQLKRTIIE